VVPVKRLFAEFREQTRVTQHLGTSSNTKALNSPRDYQNLELALWRRRPVGAVALQEARRSEGSLTSPSSTFRSWPVTFIARTLLESSSDDLLLQAYPPSTRAEQRMPWADGE
jgi:hypothetical protein